MSRFIDLAGTRFGRLVVVERNGKYKNEKILWKCKCDCGKEKNVTSGNLKSGRQKSCGCLDYERKLHHGDTKDGIESAEYKAWKNSKKRCYNKKDNFYEEYGGRGIKVCDRWLHSFENFLEDMGRRPSPNHSIDRIEVNGDYSPKNCKWSTMTEQIINQRIRRDNTSGHKGVSWDKQIGKWRVYISHNKRRVNIGYFADLSEAIASRKVAEIKYSYAKASSI